MASSASFAQQPERANAGATPQAGAKAGDSTAKPPSPTAPPVSPDGQSKASALQPSATPKPSVAKDIPLREVTEPTAPPGIDPAKLKIEVIEEKHPNGKMQSRTEGYRDKDGSFLKHGLSQEWHESGELKLETHYAHDVQHGRRTAFYANGQALSEGSYVNGMEHGKYTKSYPDGKPMTIWTFHMGAWHGVLTEYHRTGHKRLEVEFVNGKRQGPQQEWDENGTLKQKTDFEDGIEQP